MIHKKILSYFLILFFMFLANSSIAKKTSKIIIKINNEIVTNSDILNEKKYLLLINQDLKNIEDNKLNSIAKNSLIREKIKFLELQKFYDFTKDSQYVEKIYEEFYLKLKINDRAEFEKLLIDINFTPKEIKTKLEIETLWNELIFTKYKDKIEINNKKLKERLKIDLKKSKFKKSYDLSEIVFTSISKKELSENYKIIVDSINEISFKNTANIYSVSDSSKFGGSIGWVGENQLSKIIQNELKKIEEGQFTKPIGVPNGFLLLKINKIKSEEIRLSLEEELEKLIVYEKNRQLNQFSSIYFKKVKNNTKLDEY
jgi:peptidyl-prolyl cis-trans isomerase SurA